MAHCDDVYEAVGIADVVDDAVVANSNPPERPGPADLSASGWPRLFGELLDLREDPVQQMPIEDL